MAKSFLGRNDLPIGLRNNNPGAMRPGQSWKGEIGEQNGFSTFSDLDWGMRALAIDMTTKRKRGLDTIAKVISVYAPSSENNTTAYINFVSGYTGIGANEVFPFNNNNLYAIMRAIVVRENGAIAETLVTENDIDRGIQLAQSGVISLGKEAGDNPAETIGGVLLLLTIGYALKVAFFPGK